MAGWSRLFKLLPKKKIYIEGDVEREEQNPAEILEGEAGPVRVTFDEGCEYEIIEREIKPAAYQCPHCKARVLVGMDFCNCCGADLRNASGNTGENNDEEL